MAEKVVQEEIAKLFASSDVVKNPMMNERIKFLEVFPEVVRDLTEVVDDPEVKDATERFQQVLLYNVVGGKLTRALTFIKACRNLTEGGLNATDVKLMYIMAWCIELLQACILVADDIMDKSETRRGRLCWYKHSHVGLMAVNDSLMLQSAVFSLLKKHHKRQPYYVDCFEVFNNTHFMTNLGQTIDSLTLSTVKDPQLHMFNETRYELMCKYKTMYYSYILPLSLAMHVVGMSDEKLHRRMEEVLTKAGVKFQAENDFLDVYGDPNVTGKVGTDIEEGKCTWLVVTALKIANEKQIQVLQECYGSYDPAHVEKVKSLYNELNLPRLYLKYEEDLHSSLLADIDTLPSKKLQALCKSVVDDVYIRNTDYTKKVIFKHCNYI